MTRPEQSKHPPEPPQQYQVPLCECAQRRAISRRGSGMYEAILASLWLATAGAAERGSAAACACGAQYPMRIATMRAAVATSTERLISAAVVWGPVALTALG